MIRRRATTWAAGAGLLALLATSACGSGLSERELAAANGTREVVSGQAQSGDAVSAEGGQAVDAGASESAGGPATSSGGASGSRAGAGTGSGTGSSQAGPGAGTGAAAAGARASRSPIVLGSIGVASGPIGDTVAPAPDGARAWVASVNARGGLNGHPVKLIIANDDADASKAAAIVRQMVEQQGVVALYGTYAPTTLQAVTPYLEQKGVPIIGGVSGNAVEETSPLVFNPQPGPTISPVGTVASIGAQMPEGQRNLAVIYCFESEQCKVNRDGVVARAAEFGVKVVYEAQVSLAQPDFSSQMSQARAAGANVVVGFFDLNSLLRMARAAHRQAWKPVLAGSFQNDTDSLKQYAADIEGLLGISLTVNYDASPLLDDYRKALRQYVPGGQLGGLGAQAWAQGKLLEAIAPRLGDTVKSADLINALYAAGTINLGGVVPPITFNHGPHRDVNHCYVATRFVSGKWTEPLGEKFRCVNY